MLYNTHTCIYYRRVLEFFSPIGCSLFDVLWTQVVCSIFHGRKLFSDNTWTQNYFSKRF